MYNILGHTHFCQCELLMYISITFERSHVENVGANSTGFQHLDKHRTVICSRLCELLLYVCICYVWTLTCVYMFHLNIKFEEKNVGANLLLTLYTCIMSNVSVTFEHWHMHTCYIWTLTQYSYKMQEHTGCWHLNKHMALISLPAWAIFSCLETQSASKEQRRN